MTIEEMQDGIIDNLVSSESLALMNDEYDLIDEMILSNETIESIGESLSKSVIEVTGTKETNYNFSIDDPRVKDYIFSPDSKIDAPVAINLDDSIIVISLNSIKEPSLQDYKDVSDEANNLLSESKTIEKKNLLVAELDTAKAENTLQSFFKAYNFITEESFVEVKRYSSLLPQEVIQEVFKIAPGNSITVDSRSGDVYIVDLININKPSSESIDMLFDQYNNFSQERVSSRISSIINQELFDSAKVNLNNLVF